MKKLLFISVLLFCTASFAQYNPIRQSSYTMAAGDSMVAITPTNIIGAEETVIAIGFDANWKTGATAVAFKVYDEISGTYKVLYDDAGTMITLSAGVSKIYRIKPQDAVLLRNFQVVRDSAGTFKDHYGTSTIITIFKVPLL